MLARVKTAAKNAPATNVRVSLEKRLCYHCTGAGFAVAACAHCCMGKDDVDNLQLFLLWWFLESNLRCSPLDTFLSPIFVHNPQLSARVKTAAKCAARKAAVRGAAARIARTTARVTSVDANALAKIAAHLAREKTVDLRHVVKAGRPPPAQMERRRQHTGHFASVHLL